VSGREVDVLVVGAGPAGALAAREVARLGRSVLLVDRSAFPRRKVCGCCLGAGALDTLDSVGLGALPTRLGGRPLRQMALSAGGRRALLRLPGGCSLSREALDAALVDAACREGVEFLPGAPARLGPVVGERRIVQVGRAAAATEVAARVVLDATGLGPGLAEPSGSPPDVAAGSRVGLAATFDDAEHPVTSGTLWMAVGRRGYVGLVRIESGLLHLAAAVDPAALKGDGAGPDSAVADILEEACVPAPSGPPVVAWQGTPPLTRAPRAFQAERVLCLGDSSGYVEPFTGEGMTWAMGAAVAVAPLAASASGRPWGAVASDWIRYHRTSLARARRLCRVLTPALRRPALVRGTLAVLTAFPSLADPVVRRAARRPSTSVRYPS